MSKEIKPSVIDPKAQENESRRIGHEAHTKEVVVDAKEDRSCHQKAKNDLFDRTGEPANAPRFEDAE
jgi:hypothetical protein